MAIFRGIEVHIPFRCGVGAAVFDEFVDHRSDGIEAFCGLGLDVGTLDAQGVHFSEVALDVVGGELLQTLAGFKNLFDDLVVDVGEVFHESHFIPQRFEGAAQKVESYGATGVA